MSLKHLFFPSVVKFKDTPFNINIRLNQYFSQPTLIVDGLIQSGDVMTHVWKTGLKVLLPKKYSPKTILLLGVGGGSNTILVSKKFPEAQITAVEIDPLMIQIARKYYGLNKVKNLKVVIADALDYAKRLDKKTHFDLVLLDCFEGKYIPTKLENLNFIEKLRNHSTYFLINRIYWYDHHLTTMHFLRSLATRFHFVTTTTQSNIIISIV